MELFKPICINMIREQTTENVVIIRRAVNATAPEVIQIMQEYIIVPLSLVFRKTERSEALLIETFECMSDIFKKSQLDSWDAFSHLLFRMLAEVSTVNGRLEVAPTSEEVKLAFTNCLTTMLKSVSTSVKRQMYSTSFRLCMGHVVTILLGLAQEKNRTLQLMAMRCLLTIVLNEVKGSPQKEDLDFRAGNAFAGFLPGISITLTQVILGTMNRSQEVASTALDLWMHVIVVVLSDTNLEYWEKVTQAEVHTEDDPKVPNIKRNSAWASSTAEKLHLLARRVQSSLVDAEPAVKVTSVKWAQEILLNCNRSLAALIPPLLDVVLMSSADGNETVAAAGRTALTDLSSHLSRSNCSLVETLEEEFCKLLIKFPSAVSAGTDSEICSLMKLLSGYLAVLHENINKILTSPLACQRFLNALFHLTQFETANTGILTRGTVTAGTVTSVEVVPQVYYRQFKHFTSHSVFEELKKVCQYLGEYGDTILLLDLLHQKMQESGVHRKQAILLVNLVLASMSTNQDSEELLYPDRTDVNSYIRSLLDCYLSQEFWEDTSEDSTSRYDQDDNISNNTDLVFISSEHVQIESQVSNILQSCLLLEGISVFASVLKTQFRVLLRSALCPVLEKAGSHVHLVSHTACVTLLRMSASCGYQSVSNMIQDNVDYITHSLIFKLKHFKANPNICQVVQALIVHASQDSLELIVDISNEVLNALDLCYSKHALPLLKVLCSIVYAISRWFPVVTEQALLVGEKKRMSFSDYVQEFHHHKVASKDVDGCHEDSEADLSLNEQEEVNEACCAEDEKKMKMPCHVTLLAEVMKRCVHLQSSTDIWTHTAVYEIIKHGIPMLSNYEDEVLPIVHQLWGPLVYRFSEDNLHLSFKAFEALVSIAEASSSFIRHRTLKEVWPKLSGYLRKQHAVSHGKGVQYTITAAYKYQLLLLQKLGLLMHKLDASEDDVIDVAPVIISYMESSQPSELQKASLGSMMQLAQCSPEGVWYILMTSFYQWSPAWSPAQSLMKVSFLPTAECSNENACLLLQYVQQK